MKSKLELKPLFIERMQELLGTEDFENYLKSLETQPPRSIRCNTLKISPLELKKRLENKGWKIKIPFERYPEIMTISNELQPGELGRSLEHLLGYYYVQEIASMFPILVLEPQQNETILDLCASPGSKTTQIAAHMKNSGTLIANELSLGRIKILATNTERCGVTNLIITKKDGAFFCKKMKEKEIYFDKILIDAPCSGEGTIRTAQRTSKMWNIHTIKKLSKIQKFMVESAFQILKPNGIIVYSTCTHAPEENEEVIDYILKKFGSEVCMEKINLPIKCKSGIAQWKDKKFNENVGKSCRIYPHKYDTEGFFIAKIRRIK